MKVVRASLRAIDRARLEILSVALAYVLSVVVGIGMVSTGNDYALQRRDAIVADAQSSGTMIAYRSGDRLQAALLDTAANLGLGGLTSTVLGFSVVGVYPAVAYRGWVGGVVSVNSQHHSRLGSIDTAIYYLMTLVLQLIPYSIAAGVGVRVGIGAWRDIRGSSRPSLFGLRKDLLRDAAIAYVTIAPLFFIASLWEFFV